MPKADLVIEPVNGNSSELVEACVPLLVVLESEMRCPFRKITVLDSLG